ncbi:hypothetical protein [Mycolicibacterium sp. P9-22]|uniref:hypothetical protein n=1 Tax=Mycolicibacterium sp. P9-22 TaxID=2024613 RepID=UPI0011EFBD98|nr:hypothetical protein [Mycolicibacterium sp. P9-22]KAA0111016.1 hypothetical protein CIW51_29555 [Mycolicibacterium sp. P9-22]
MSDFRHDTGLAYTPTALAYARSHLVVVSRAAALPGPIDGPTPRDTDTLADARHSAQMGMTAKLAVDPADIEAIHTALSPTADEVAEAQATIARLGSDGQHITSGADVSRLSSAHSTLRKARHFRTPLPSGSGR